MAGKGPRLRESEGVKQARGSPPCSVHRRGCDQRPQRGRAPTSESASSRRFVARVLLHLMEACPPCGDQLAGVRHTRFLTGEPEGQQRESSESATAPLGFRRLQITVRRFGATAACTVTRWCCQGAGSADPSWSGFGAFGAFGAFGLVKNGPEHWGQLAISLQRFCPQRLPWRSDQPGPPTERGRHNSR